MAVMYQPAVVYAVVPNKESTFSDCILASDNRNKQQVYLVSKSGLTERDNALNSKLGGEIRLHQQLPPYIEQFSSDPHTQLSDPLLPVAPIAERRKVEPEKQIGHIESA
jgi:hypothetical protein